MAVWTLGLNHRTASLDLRSRFAFMPDQIEAALHGLHRQLGQNNPAATAPEAAILSTCNRTEIYCASNQTAIDNTRQCASYHPARVHLYLAG